MVIGQEFYVHIDRSHETVVDACDHVEMNTSATLDCLNSAEVERLIPLVVYLVLVIASGIFGNLMVLYVYKTKYRSSNGRTFVVCLSCIDIFICVVDIPLELVTVFRQYNFTSAAVCRLSVFLSTWCTLATGLLLLAIAVDRYRKVCRPFQWQISPTCARATCAGSIIVALMCSWPSPVIYGIRTAQDQRYNVTKTVCAIRDDMVGTRYPLINNIMFAVLFVGTLVSISVMYCFIGARVQRHEKRQNRLTRTHVPLPVDVVDASNASELTVRSGLVALGDHDKTAESDNTLSDSATLFDSEITDTKLKQELEAEPCMASVYRIGNVRTKNRHSDRNNRYILGLSAFFGKTLSVKGKTKYSVTISDSHISGINTQTRNANRRQLKSQRTAYIMFLISLTFIITYLPILCILLLRSISSRFVEQMSDTVRAVCKFFLRSFYLSCAVNPVIYGLCDTRFRKASKQLITSKLRCCK